MKVLESLAMDKVNKMIEVKMRLPIYEMTVYGMVFIQPKFTAREMRLLEIAWCRGIEWELGEEA